MTTNPSDSSPPFNPYFALIFGVFAVSTGAIFARLADANPLVIAAYRLGIAALVLTPIAWWKARDELKRLTSREVTLALTAGFFLAMHFAAGDDSLLGDGLALCGSICAAIYLLPRNHENRKVRPLVLS
jgi:drug/metabolite transporter (DMT)-like permease